MKFICKFWYEGVQKCDNTVQIECQKSHYIMYAAWKPKELIEFQLFQNRVSSIILVESRSTNSWTIPSFFKKKNDVTIKNTYGDVRNRFHPRGLELPGASWLLPPLFSVSLFLSRTPHYSPVAPGCIEPFGTRITRVLRRRTRRETI